MTECKLGKHFFMVEPLPETGIIRAKSANGSYSRYSVLYSGSEFLVLLVKKREQFKGGSVWAFKKVDKDNKEEYNICQTVRVSSLPREIKAEISKELV